MCEEKCINIIFPKLFFERLKFLVKRSHFRLLEQSLAEELTDEAQQISTFTKNRI